MKIALPSRNNQIDGHFGHCEYFTVLTVDKSAGVILSSETIASPAGCGCKSNIAATLADMGVELMLAGNMGQGAVNVLSRSGITVLRGCSGDITQVAQSWLEGKLSDSGDSCLEHGNGHEHGHECHNHK